MRLAAGGGWLAGWLAGPRPRPRPVRKFESNGQKTQGWRGLAGRAMRRGVGMRCESGEMERCGIAGCTNCTGYFFRSSNTRRLHPGIHVTPWMHRRLQASGSAASWETQLQVEI